jgi:O-antigen ligase
LAGVSCMAGLRFFRRISLLKKETEFFLILVWILFFPGKKSYLYFLTSAALVVLFLLKDLIFIKNAGLSPATTGLFVVNLIFVVSIFFSSYRIRSFLLVSDILLISLYFFFSFVDPDDQDRYFFIILFAISLFSLVYVLNSVVLVFREKDIFFESPILQGVGSGAGVIVAVFYLLKKFKIHLLILLLVNLSAVYISGSKAAFLGMVISVILMVVLRQKNILPMVIGLLILTFVVPNPVKNIFYTSTKHDPYVFNRLDIWELSWNMFQDNFLTGVGIDNYQDVSKKYNFKQKHGPANYFKIPRSPHNDYLKIMAETGLAGAILVLAFLIIILIRVFSSSLFNINKVLILYILFQAFLFNIIFQFFFLFLLIFLLKNLFEKKLFFQTLQVYTKMIIAGFVILIFVFGYLFPFFSDSYMAEAKKSQDYKKAMELLERSEFFNPFDQNVYYSKALLFFSYFQRTFDLDSFCTGVENLKITQRLNRNYLPAYLLEFDFYREILKKGLNYQAFSDELIAPLKAAEAIAPLNPFVRLMKAVVFMEFGEGSKARAEALAALELEPDYVSARYFLHKNFNYFPDQKKFESEINAILRKARKYSPGKDTYLYELFKVPPGY